MKLKSIVRAIALLSVAAPVLAQTAAPAQRVEITGSNIKRLASEGVLPVQVITAEQLERTGVQTAEDLIRSLGMNAAGADNAVSNNNVFGGDTDRLTGGSANANLRGLGPGSTLVLLNGRRVANHGMSGAAVDLNSIPMSAIARVEVLKDGASAIYGTDAIGGVINFILKRDLQGVTVGANMSKPIESGGVTRRAFVTGGFGSIDKQGFNLLGSLTVDKNDILRGSDRDWANGFQPAMGLSPNSSSHPFANIITAAGSAMGTTGSTVGTGDATKYTRINLLGIGGQCDAIATGQAAQPQLWGAGNNMTNANARYMCNTDYGDQYMLSSPKEAVNLVLRGTFALSPQHTGFVEAVGSRTAVKAELTPSQFSATAAAGNFYPVNGPYYLNLKNYGVNDFDPTKPIAYRWRMQDFGNRVQENVAENTRLLAGLEGELGAYSYKLAIGSAQAEAWTNLIDGYAYSAKLNAALKTGLINPWVAPGQTQTAAAMDLIESTKARGRLQGGKTGLTSVDGMLSGELFKLPAGTVDFAAGFDLRRESYEFAGTPDFTCVSTLATVIATDVLLCPGNSAVPKVSRDVRAVFAELAVPLMKGLDLQLAVRHDSYSGVGSTTNPKVSLRWQPNDMVLFRGSVNTGFKAPSFQQLAVNTARRDYTGTFSDPVKCQTDPTQCSIAGLDYYVSGYPDLKPETSRQASLGMVFAPMRGLSVSADLWRVSLADRIRTLTIGDVVSNYGLFSQNFIRDANGNIDVVKTGWINAAGSATRGLDWGVALDGKHDSGSWTAKLNGTYMIRHQEQALENLPMVDLVGTFGLRTLYLRNKANAELTWNSGAWSTTGTATYNSSYADQNMAAKGVMPATANTRVGATGVLGLFVTYKGIKSTTLTVGVRNLLDTRPPFTHHDVDDVAGAGWDPRVADPFGRTLTLSAKYEF